MASYLVIGKASSKAALPLISMKTIWSPKSFRFHRAISTALNVDHHLHPKRSSSSSLQSHHYATASNTTEQAKKLVDENLVRLVTSEIKTLDSANVIPKGFPFKVENNVEGETLLLTREYPNEIIKVEVNMSDLETKNDNDKAQAAESDNNDDSSNDSDTNSDDSDKESHSDSTDHSDHEGERTESGFPVVVKVSKSESCLEFSATVSSEDVSIQSLTIKGKHNSTDHVEGPGFSSLSEHLQHGLLRFLEIRGIDTNLAEFLNKNKINMNRKEELVWLKKLKKFVS